MENKNRSAFHYEQNKQLISGIESNKNVIQSKENLKQSQEQDKFSTIPLVPLVSRDEIIKKRKERKKATQDENKRIREQKLLEEKLYKRSDKIQIITSKAHQKYQNNTTTIKSNQKFKKFNNSNFNLLDFIIEKSKNKQPLKEIKKNSSTKITLNRGKRRENKIKKSYSRLKKIILKNRQTKKITSTIVDPVDITTTTINMEKLNLNDENLISNSITIHSRKFRPYCDNLTSKNLCNLTEKILSELFRFQKRAYEKNEIKARAHKRFVVGFKETGRQLDINKLKFIIIAPDCESCDLPGGIDETISNIKLKCKEINIPYLFSVRRRQLGYILYKKVPVNCVGIISYDGVQDIFHELIQCLNEDRDNYVKKINCL